MYNNMNKILDWQYRSELDFIRFPLLIHRAKREVIDLILGGSFLAMSSLYNKGWPGGKTNRFHPEDFKCRIVRNGVDTMLYITLPATDSRAPMASTHIAITYKNYMTYYSDIRVFNVERSNRNTTAIGEMKFTPDGKMQAHISYGDAMSSDEENIRQIWEIAFDTEFSFQPSAKPRSVYVATASY